MSTPDLPLTSRPKRSPDQRPREIPAVLPPPGHAYLGEADADPDSFEHPDWCDRTWCTAHFARGDHWSTPWRIEPVGSAGFPLIELALWTDAYQPVAESPAWVEMRLTHASLSRTLAVQAYEMNPSQMRELAALLIEVADRADQIGDRALAATAAREAAEQLEGGEPDAE